MTVKGPSREEVVRTGIPLGAKVLGPQGKSPQRNRLSGQW